jgi:hypothetical protein
MTDPQLKSLTHIVKTTTNLKPVQMFDYDEYIVDKDQPFTVIECWRQLSNPAEWSRREIIVVWRSNAHRECVRVCRVWSSSVCYLRANLPLSARRSYDK